MAVSHRINRNSAKKGGDLIKTIMTFWIESMKYFFKNNRVKFLVDDNGIANVMYEKSIVVKGPKVTAFGGGTGLSTMLRGIKKYTSNITAVVTVADDGGGSGEIRRDLKILPPGDIRNCILALASTEPIMEQLLQYRFTEGNLKGQSFGNLFLAAMNGISSNFEEAIRKMSDVLAVTGRVLPVTNQDVKLCAILENGVTIRGESMIARQKIKYQSPIDRVYFMPEDVLPLSEVMESIYEADIIIIGPGSLYTSIIPNLIVKGVAEMIRKSKALKVYICNVMTQPGETEGYTAFNHIKAIEKHAGEGLIDYCIVNKEDIPTGLLDKYIADKAYPVIIDRDEFKKSNIKLIEGNILKVYGSLIRHDTDKLSDMIASLALKNVLSKDKRRVIDYYYVKDKLGKNISV